MRLSLARSSSSRLVRGKAADGIVRKNNTRLLREYVESDGSVCNEQNENTQTFLKMQGRDGLFGLGNFRKLGEKFPIFLHNPKANSE